MNRNNLKNNLKNMFYDTLRTINTSDDWCKFLEYSTAMDKYSFQNTVLLYAQNKDATICSTFDEWNNRGRYIKKNSKGMKVYRKNTNGEYLISTVFDISQTVGENKPLWKLSKEYTEEALNLIEQRLDIEPEEKTLVSRLNNIVEEAMQQEAKVIEAFSDKKHINIEELNQVIKATITYSVLCKMNEEDTKENIFKNINMEKYLLDKSILNFIGSITNKTSMKMIKVLELVNSEIIEEERGQENDEQSRIHDQRRIRGNESGINSSRSFQTREVGENDVILHGELRGNAIRTDTDNGRVRRISDPSGPGSKGEAKYIQIGIDETNFNKEPITNSIDATHPGNRQPGRRNDNSRDVSFEQHSTRELDNNIDIVLLKGSGFVDGKERIYNYFTSVEDVTLKVDYLKKEYGIGGVSGTSENGIHLNYSYDSNGFEVSINREPTKKYSWTNVSERIQKLIDEGAYYNPEVVVPKVNLKSEVIKSVNYHLPTNFEYPTSIKSKYVNNIEAIKLLKTLELQNREAVLDEQHILAKYVGWGGMPQVFSSSNENWANEYSELKQILTEDEYNAARSSTLSAFYTNTEIVSQMYRAVEQFGFKKGTILEPSMGIGNFFGTIPPTLENTKLTGIEIDDLTGRIAKKLYPDANIQITGFEKANIPDNYFDVVIGNVPFGNYKLNEPRYNKFNFLIHDHFFAKAIDTVKVNGVVAFITSKGTLDKTDSSLRKYISARAEFIGAIRLPNNAFKTNANTEVTSDIIFLKKRETLSIEHEKWLDVNKNDDGIIINNYFIENPHMMLGNMILESGMYGQESTLVSDGRPLDEALATAINNLPKNILHPNQKVQTEVIQDTILIPTEESIKNNAFFIKNNQIYQRHGSEGIKISVSQEQENRIKSLIEVKKAVNTLLNEQLAGCTNEELKVFQDRLNNTYDTFANKYGTINDKINDKAFSDDPDYLLLCSLEKIDEESKKITKTAIFTERTIKLQSQITHVDTAIEALAVCLNEKGYIDIDYMCTLTNKSPKGLLNNVQGIIFKNPTKSIVDDLNGYETADEYLSGNVRNKLDIAIEAAKNNPMFNINVEKLKAVQPKDLTAGEIEVKLGSTWIPTEDIKNFIIETFSPSSYSRSQLNVEYVPIISEWKIDRVNSYGDIAANETWGTKRANAYDLVEQALNLKIPTIYDVDADDKRILNARETTLAREKQEQLKNEFKKWIFQDPERRERLTEKYNKELNCNMDRKYDGSHLTFPGMAYNISLREHQKNGVAHILYGESGTLLAHCVGAGKTWTMTASAMELKRLGLANKILVVVPNHLTEQWGKEWLQAYPKANLLVANKKDFTKENRKRFASKIATGNYDAIIIGHSAFSKISVTQQTQEEHIKEEINNIQVAILNLADKKGTNNTRLVKRLESTKKNLEASLNKQLEIESKDDVVYFEQLGIDKIFLDEAHEFKNLYLHTKMQNIAGIPQTKAKKSSDLYMKISYLNKLNQKDNSVVFATGTPVSNSMTEMFTMQRYLQGSELRNNGMAHFDAWAGNFGEVVSAFEVAPDGSGFRSKTRFSQFVNLPELMSMFRKSADIQTSEMLNLPTPQLKDGKAKIVAVPASDFLKDFIQNNLMVRSQQIKNGSVDPTVDNMLKVTTDGRKVAIDPRTYDPNLPDMPGSKVNKAVDNIYKIWENTKVNKSAQLIFCDCSTPNKESFNLYDDMKNKLIGYGVPGEEIKFIHDAKDDIQKSKLFSNVRSGKVRILIGSTAKMGAGTNVQNKLVALHHIDVPWRPSDIEQREGRILRQGNENKEVEIFRYITEGSFDAYSWQTIETKQKFISQVMSGDTSIRKAEDMDSAALNYAEIKAIASGNPLVLKKMEVDTEVARLKILESQFNNSRYSLQDKVIKHLPNKISTLKDTIKSMALDKDMIKIPTGEDFKINLKDQIFDNKAQAGEFLIDFVGNVMKDGERVKDIGVYAGLSLDVHKYFDKAAEITLKGNKYYTCELSTSGLGSITRIENTLKNIPESLEKRAVELIETERQLGLAKIELEKPFMYTNKLNELLIKQSQINTTLDLDLKDKEIIKEDTEIIQDIPNVSNLNQNTKKLSITEKLKLAKVKSQLQDKTKDRSTNKITTIDR